MNSDKQAVDIFLHPGQYAVGDQRCKISTLLGSCVAITLWHPLRKIGAMSHFLLPTQGRRARASACPDGRYGDQVLELMLQELKLMRVAPGECQAKIFGGGSMLGRPAQTELFNVGQMNGEMARRQLHERGIPIVSESLFGAGHRKIVFDVGSGDVWSRRGKLVDPQAPTGVKGI